MKYNSASETETDQNPDEPLQETTATFSEAGFRARQMVLEALIHRCARKCTPTRQHAAAFMLVG